MMRLSRQSSRRTDRGDARKGATMIEFSLSFLLFVIIMVGTVEASRLIWAYTTLAHAARRGARYVMVHNGRNPATNAQVETVVKAYTVGLEDANVTVTPSYDDCRPLRRVRGDCRGLLPVQLHRVAAGVREQEHDADRHVQNDVGRIEARQYAKLFEGRP